MPDLRRERSLEVALDHYWDAVLSGATDPRADDPDPGLTATVRRVAALDQTAAPHPAFASTLWEHLMYARPAAPAADVGPELARYAEPFSLGQRPISLPQTHPMLRVAAAIFLTMLLAGSLVAALYPHWPRERGGISLVAPVASPAPTSAASATPLVEFTLTDVAPFVAEGGIAITGYPPGGFSRELAGKESPEIFYIAAGPLTMAVEAAPQPVRVIPQHGPALATGETTLGKGEEITLQTGALVMLPEKAIVTLRNDGTAPSRMLDVLWATESYSTEAGGASWTRASPSHRQEITSPTTITLRQSTMESGEIMPGPTSANTALSLVPVDQENHRWELRVLSNGAVRNPAAEPVEVYVLTLASGIDAEGESVATASPTAAALELLWESTNGAHPLPRAYGLGIDPQGNIWVSDANNDRFQIFAPDGTYLDTWGTPGTGDGEFEFFAAKSGYGVAYGDIAFDVDGNIYVLDTGNFRVQKFAPDRSFLLAWGSEGKGDGQFIAPGGIAVGPYGRIYVSDEQRDDIQKFDAEGRYLGTIGGLEPDQGGIRVAAGVAVGNDGDIWLADYGGHMILRFGANGELRDTWGKLGDGPGELLQPNDVAVDALGRVYVADDGNNRIQVFTPDGQLIAWVGGPGMTPRQFTDVVAVAVTPDGVVYASDDTSVEAFRLALPNGPSGTRQKEVQFPSERWSLVGKRSYRFRDRRSSMRSSRRIPCVSPSSQPWYSRSSSRLAPAVFWFSPSKPALSSLPPAERSTSLIAAPTASAPRPSSMTRAQKSSPLMPSSPRSWDSGRSTT